MSVEDVVDGPLPLRDGGIDALLKPEAPENPIDVRVFRQTLNLSRNWAGRLDKAAPRCL